MQNITTHFMCCPNALNVFLYVMTKADWTSHGWDMRPFHWKLHYKKNYGVSLFNIIRWNYDHCDCLYL